MRVNVYAEELPNADDPRAVERRATTAETGQTFFGARLYLRSASELHDAPADDDRSAITIWGPRAHVAALLRRMADAMESES